MNLWGSGCVDRYRLNGCRSSNISSSNNSTTEVPMKFSRQQVQNKPHVLPRLRFESQKLTSFAGLVILQKFFAQIKIKERLRPCFRQIGKASVYRRHTIFLQLIVHLLLGFRELQHARFYEEDPMVKRILGLTRLPNVSTISRMLRKATHACVDHVRALLREMVLERLVKMQLARITLDFDGSVQSTSRHAEGTAVGFNKQKKGARSYYPLFCTISQLNQVFDVLFRPGNVHDSKGALEFILHCVDAVRAKLPQVQIELRMDSAFFSDEIVTALSERDIEFTISVPFERFTELKTLIENRQKWPALREETSYFEPSWKPQKWSKAFRFLCIRTKTQKQRKGPLQLDLFEPRDYGYEFKVIVTNKTLQAQNVVTYHEGRGSQEGIIADLKTDCHLDYIPVRTLCGNQLYHLAGMMAHNLARELQMSTKSPLRGTTTRRAALWIFEKLSTLRNTMLHRAGRLTSPSGALTLTISATKLVKEYLLGTLKAIDTPQ